MKEAGQKKNDELKDHSVKLNMTFTEAMKKALSTPLPKKKAKKKSTK